MENKDIELTYWRKPTKAEIKFGYGATHYRDFNFNLCLDTDGKPLLSFIANDDRLKYFSCNHEYFPNRKYIAKVKVV